MAENKTTNKETEKKPNWFVSRWQSVSKWVHELKVELKKVVWPSRKDVVRNTLVVIAVVLVVGACIWAFDWLSAAVVKALINLAQG